MIRVAGFALDAATSISITRKAQVTTHPVEEGGVFADHRRRDQPQVVIKGIISDTPIGTVAAEREPGGLPSADAYAHFVAIDVAGDVVRIETPLEVFDNMMLSNLATPVDSGTGDSLEFAATFIQIDIVETERAFVRVEIPQPPGGKKNRGAKPSKKKEANAESLGTQRVSLAKQGFSAIGNLFGL